MRTRKYDTSIQRRFDPETRATVAIAAEPAEALATLLRVIHAEYTDSPEPHERVDRALRAMFRAYDAAIARKTPEFALATWTQGIWTMVEDPRDSLPGDAVSLARLAAQLQTQVVARIVRAADRTYGFAYWDADRCRRLFLQLSGLVVEDEGQLDDEVTPIKRAPAECVDQVWGTLVPEDQPTRISVQFLRPSRTAPEDPDAAGPPLAQ